MIKNNIQMKKRTVFNVESELHPVPRHCWLTETAVDWVVLEINRKQELAWPLLYIAFAWSTSLILIVHGLEQEHYWLVSLLIQSRQRRLVWALKTYFEYVQLMKRRFWHRENEVVNEVFHNADCSPPFRCDHEWHHPPQCI